jgi:hypothetical protein
MEILAKSLIEMIKLGAVDSKDKATEVLEIIERNSFQETLEPLWRSLKYVLSEDESWLLVNPIIREIIDDVLPLIWMPDRQEIKDILGLDDKSLHE